MTLYQHIQELRAELSACCNARELRQIELELKAALAEQAKLDARFNEMLAAM